MRTWYVKDFYFERVLHVRKFKSLIIGAVSMNRHNLSSCVMRYAARRSRKFNFALHSYYAGDPRNV